MYYSFIYPYLQYCNEVWGNAYAVHINRLKLLQKRAIRIIAKVDRYEHTAPLFKKFKILPLSHINDYMTGQLMFRVHNASLPSPVLELFVRNSVD